MKADPPSALKRSHADYFARSCQPNQAMGHETARSPQIQQQRHLATSGPLTPLRGPNPAKTQNTKAKEAESAVRGAVSTPDARRVDAEGVRTLFSVMAPLEQCGGRMMVDTLATTLSKSGIDQHRSRRSSSPEPEWFQRKVGNEQCGRGSKSGSHQRSPAAVTRASAIGQSGLRSVLPSRAVTHDIEAARL